MTSGNPQKTATKKAGSARSRTTPKAPHARTWRERAAAKRRQAIEAQAIDHLKAALADLPGRRMGTAERQVRQSPRPMSTARAIVREWRQARSVSPETARLAGGNGTGAILEDETAVPDLSAATEARAAILRRQLPELRQRCAYEDELAELETVLLAGQVSQKVFDKRCRKVAERALPNWMNGESGMNLEPDKNPEGHRIVVGIGQSEDEVICRYFGTQGPPENTVFIVRKLVSPSMRKEAT